MSTPIPTLDTLAGPPAHVTPTPDRQEQPMHIDKDRVQAIAKSWEESHAALTDVAGIAGDSSGEWAPAVRAAVASFAASWKADLTQLAAEAETTRQILADATASYAITDQEAAERMRRIARSVPPPT